MSRAEEAALKAYPEQDMLRAPNTHKSQLNKERRRIYRQGYYQAEKDTIERTESHLDSVLPNFLDVDTVKWIIKDFKKAMEEE